MSWPLVNLQEVAFFQEGPGVRKWQFRTEGIKLINVKNIVNHALITENSDKFLDPEEVKEKYSHFLVDVGDLVIASSGATWGKTAWVEKKHLPLCMNTSMIRFKTLNSNFLEIRYLRYFLQTNFFKNQMEKLITGSAQPNFGSSHLKQIEIPLPPLPEQIRIAVILDKADAIRRKRQQAIQLADDFLRSVFLDMFGDPVTNPKGWEVKPLKDIALIQIGPFGTQLHKEDYINGGIPLINPTHIIDGKISPKNNFTISTEKHAELPEYHLKIDDVIMGRRGEMGRCSLVTDRESGWLCGTGSLFIRPYKPSVFSEYLQRFLSTDSIKNHLESEALGATMPNLNKTIVGNIQIPIPSDDSLIRFARIKQSFLKIQASSLNFGKNDLFNALSQRAFAGAL